MMEPALRKILRHWPFERMRLDDVAPDGLMPGARLGAQKFAAQCDGQLGALYVNVPDAGERTRILNEVRALLRTK